MTIAKPEELELVRILNLPVQLLPDEEAHELFCYDRMLAPAFAKGDRLFVIQAGMVAAYEAVRGGLFPVGVGWGKSGASIMISQSAYNSGRRKILLLVPVQQVGGLLKRHIPEWRGKVPLSVPFHFLAGRSAASRKAIVDSNAPGVYVFPYSLLSAPDTLYLLEKIKPHTVIADEVHNLKNPKAARTKRLLEVLKEQVPRPELVGMSGTITAKKIGEYHHLATLALGDHSPLPRSGNMAWHWGQLINNDAEAPDARMTRLMEPLLDWAGETFPGQKFDVEQTESYRRAYRLRLTSAPGIVATGDEEIGASLCITNSEPAPPGQPLLDLIKKVQDEMTTPTGQAISHSIHTFKWIYELSAGFYNNLVWPTVEEVQKNRRVGPVEAELMLEKAKTNLAAHQEYTKSLREFFAFSPAGLDTPREVANSIVRYGSKHVPKELCELYHVWKASKFDGMPERKKVPVRLDSYKVDHAVNWCKERQGGVLWVYHQELGEWLMDALVKAGADPVHCPAGADDVIESIGDPLRGGKGDRICVASMSAHGTGKNLQAFHEQLYVQWPRQPIMAEQTLGRLHRNGQEADTVFAHTNLTIEFDHVNRAAQLNDSLYIQQTTGVRQKTVIADYDPMPLIYSDEFLREQGAQPERLSKDQKARLKELFGDVVQ